MMKLKTSLFCVFEYVLYFCYVVRIVDSVEYSVRVTDYGRVKGVVEYVHGQKIVEKFFGIPYASPPVGNLRLEVCFLLPVFNRVLLYNCKFLLSYFAHFYACFEYYSLGFYH